MLNDRILPTIGPVLLALLALAQPFSRGLTYSLYSLLVLWSLLWLVYGRTRWPMKVKPIPSQWYQGLAVFLLVYVFTAVIGEKPLRSLGYFFLNIYVFLALPITWLVLSQRPKLIYWLPFLYALGLIITGFITFEQADYCLKCVRAKSQLGIMDLSGVLIQLGPIMVGALAFNLAQPDRGNLQKLKTIFLILALGAAFIATINNCTRITILLLPLLAAVIFVVNIQKFKNLTGLILLVLGLAGVILLVQDNGVLRRFKDITKPTAQSLNNRQRFYYWEHGFNTFAANPIFGVGPAAQTNLPSEKIATKRQKNNPYHHAHNVFLTIMAEMGLVGLVAFLYFITKSVKILWPYRRSPDNLTFFWAWSAFAVMLHLFLNGVTDSVINNKIIMILNFSVLGSAMWTALGREPINLAKSKGQTIKVELIRG